MIIKAKYKICKRLGSGVFEKCQTQKFTLSEARGGKVIGDKKKRRKGASEFGGQLLEKQKARYTYGLSERQFGNYVKASVEKKGADSVKTLVTALESRLDNVVYRLGIAKTRRLARQLVSHGHITVNGRRVSIPSYRVTQGEKIGIREGSKARTYFQGMAERLAGITTPGWLSLDPMKQEGTVVRAPEQKGEELLFDPAIVIQFYSR